MNEKKHLIALLIILIIIISIGIPTIQSLLTYDKIELHIYFKDKAGQELTNAIVYIRILPTPSSEPTLLKTCKTGKDGGIHLTLDKGRILREWRKFIEREIGQIKYTPFLVSLMIDAIKFDGEYLYAVDGATIILDPIKRAYEKKVVYFSVNYVEKINVSMISSELNAQSIRLRKDNLRPTTPGFIFEEKLVDYKEWSDVEIPLLGFKADENNAGDTTFDADTFYGRALAVIQSSAKKYFQVGIGVLAYQTNTWSFSIGGDSYYESRADDATQDFSTKRNSKVTHGYISLVGCNIRWEKYITYVGGFPIREKHKIFLNYIRGYTIGDELFLLTIHRNEYPDWIGNFTLSYAKSYIGKGQYNNQWTVGSSPNRVIVMDLLAQTSIDYGFIPIPFILMGQVSGPIPFPLSLGFSWREDYTSEMHTGIRFDAEEDAIIRVYLYSNTDVKYNIGGSYYNLCLAFIEFDEVSPHYIPQVLHPNNNIPFLW